MMRKGSAWRRAGIVIVLSLALVGTAFAAEIQLAGIRLGSPQTEVMGVFGQPDGVVIGGPTQAAAGAGGMGMPGAEGGGMPGMGPEGGMGMPGMMPGMEGGMMPGMGAAAPGMGSMMPGAMPGEMGMTPGMSSGMMPGMGMGMEGGGMGAGAGAAAGGGAGGGLPRWAMPVAVELQDGEIEWIYSSPMVKAKNMEKPARLDVGIVLGFVFDDHGFVNCIAIAGKSCSYARTALWKEPKFIKLGDSYMDIIMRYGIPDDTKQFDAGGVSGMQPMTGQIQVSFTEGSNTFSRDLILEYTERNNISFTLHDMKVTRIVVWGAQ